MRDKSHMEQVVRWAEYVKSVPRSEWKPKLKSFVDAQIIMGLRFRKKLAESDEGKEILKRLREERANRRLFSN